ncbi:hypothetical protein [Luteimonas sp. R10]|uniref:hypothetical protein n=1 Tax=Luteimonas sp. R10 TaxID=3108176 RepID=UPI0030862117|nr:hypothetical protein U3649_11130 [Luteimonas sp. R10]
MNTWSKLRREILDALPEKERLRIAERVFAEAGFTSILPTIYPIDPALPAAEAQALAAVGLRATDQTGARADTARARYVSTFLDLFHDADTPTQLAEKLGLDPSRIRQCIRDRTLLAIELNGEKRVPRFQFEGSTEVPGLPKVLALVGDQVSPLAFSMWFLTPTPDLTWGEGEAPTSPREWLLRTGEVDFLRTLRRTTKTLQAGDVLARIGFAGGDHPTKWNELRYWGPTGSRFDHHLPNAAGKAEQQERGVLYAAKAVQTCLAKVFRDTRVVDVHKHQPYLAVWKLDAEPTLLDLTGEVITRMGPPPRSIPALARQRICGPSHCTRLTRTWMASRTAVR